MSTYSLIDVQATFTGPGISIPIGAGAGLAEEGISIEAIDNVGHMVIGGDGTPMQVLQVTKGYRVTLHLLKTSLTNAPLMAAQQIQRSSGALWGRNSISLTDILSGDEFTGQAVAFEKTPRIDYDKPGKMVDWTFLVGIGDWILGVSV